MFSTNLRAALAEQGMTQEELARRCGVSLRAAQKWVLGESEPTGEKLVRVADALDRDAGWFYAEPDLPSAA